MRHDRESIEALDAFILHEERLIEEAHEHLARCRYPDCRARVEVENRERTLNAWRQHRLLLLDGLKGVNA